jgi:hypothetical protein
MKSAQLSKRIRYTKPGEIIVVPMGMILPHAVEVERISTYDGQIVAMGKFVKRDGCSVYRIGDSLEVCLGWQNVAA